ncbi:MAG: sulfatase-like hydrolase/transferase [Verrucomicrobiae bacterium]|nr:sulfatase-like hydrolase/transferase [Verrucomicrobiae bacterium]
MPPSWQYRSQFRERPVAAHEAFMRYDQGQVLQDAPTEAWKQYRELYRRRIQRLDKHIGDVLGRLRDYGASERTMVIITSDHGDMDTQHRLVFKGRLCSNMPYGCH